MDKSKILIVGIDSILGDMAASCFHDCGHDYIGTSRRGVNPNHLFLDLCDNMEEWEIPDDIGSACLFAGVTGIQECEENPEYAYSVNVEGVFALAKRLLDRGVFIMFPSSNYVFDGSESYIKADAPQNPQLEYGRHQKEMEDLLTAYSDRVAILRMSKVFSPGYHLFCDWASKLRAGKPITPFDDLYMAPSSIQDVVDVISKICFDNVSGTFQISGVNDISYTKAAYHIAEHVGADKSLVIPTLGSKHDLLPETLKKHNTLDCSETTQNFGFTPSDFESVLDMVMGWNEKTKLKEVVGGS